jgi:hypothetical protein
VDEEIKKGDRVSLDVEWPNGRVSRMHGTLVMTTETEAYVDTDMGPVVGPVESLEREDEE